MIIFYLTRFYYLLGFGEVQWRVVETINRIACEIEIVNGKGKVIGYWSYGSFCPSYPYIGGGKCKNSLKR